MKLKDYKRVYRQVYARIDLEGVLDSYGLSWKAYSGNMGREFLIRCPFPSHEDMSPSFSINEKTGIYHCFVCGAGDFFQFIKNVEEFERLGQAIQYIKDKVGIRDEEFEIDFSRMDKSFEEFGVLKKKKEDKKIEIRETKLPTCEPAWKHMRIVKKRVSMKIAKKWCMMYCNGSEKTWEQKYVGRLIIPVHYEGKIVSFAARDMTGKADEWKRIRDGIRKKKKTGEITEQEIDELVKKYECRKILYPFNAPTAFVFFNWDVAKKNTEYVILVEGILDAIQLIEWGYNAMAILSCSMNDYRINLITSTFDKVYICLDNDDKVDSNGVKKNPGQDAAKKLMEKFEDVDSYNIVLPVGKDPDECLREEFEECYAASHNLIKSFSSF